MKKVLLLIMFYSAAIIASAQQSNSILFTRPADPIPVKRLVENRPFRSGPMNNRAAAKTTAGINADWYNLWDEMNDTSATSLSHLYLWDVARDSNIYDVSGIYPPYYIFTHGLGMSFDPSDSAYYFHAVDTNYRVSSYFDFTQAYQLDSFWVPGEYIRSDTTSSIVDSLIVEFLVSQNGSSPDSGAYQLMAIPSNPIYFPFTPDAQPRFATSRYYRLQDECVDPVLTKVVHRRYAFPLTSADAFIYKKLKFALTSPLVVLPGKYLAAYVYFKGQVTYPLGTLHSAANYYWMYAGEPNGVLTWFPQSAHNTATGYTGSRNQGLIATKQIRYNDAGFTFLSHNVLLPASAYAHTGPNNNPPGFTVPYMAFHITWPVPSLAIAPLDNDIEEVNAYPNPAANTLNISFALHQPALVKVTLSNIMGQVVAVQVMKNTANGTIVFQAANLSAGIYVYTLEAGNLRKTGRVVIQN
jgi:hypothetical protein